MKRSLPALFDRLSLSHEKSKGDKWREILLRDIESLLNDASRSADLKLSGWQHAESSVINYGLPSLSKRIPVNIDPILLARHIQQIIATFEPRLDSRSIKVIPLIDGEHSAVLAILFDIYGSCLFSEGEKRINLRIALDYSCGAVRVI